MFFPKLVWDLFGELAAQDSKLEMMISKDSVSSKESMVNGRKANKWFGQSCLLEKSPANN